MVAELTFNVNCRCDINNSCIRFVVSNKWLPFLFRIDHICNDNNSCAHSSRSVHVRQRGAQGDTFRPVLDALQPRWQHVTHPIQPDALTTQRIHCVWPAGKGTLTQLLRLHAGSRRHGETRQEKRRHGTSIDIPRRASTWWDAKAGTEQGGIKPGQKVKQPVAAHMVVRRGVTRRRVVCGSFQWWTLCRGC